MIIWANVKILLLIVFLLLFLKVPVLSVLLAREGETDKAAFVDCLGVVFGAIVAVITLSLI